VLLTPDEGAVEELATAAADPALHDRVHARYPDSAEDDLDAGVGEDVVEQCRVLPVPVADQEPHGVACVLTWMATLARNRFGYLGYVRLLTAWMRFSA
jgi:hypothetical protein